MTRKKKKLDDPMNFGDLVNLSGLVVLSFIVNFSGRMKDDPW